MLTRRRNEWTEEGVEAEAEAMMVSGNMGGDVFHKILTNWTSTPVAGTMNFSREDRDKGKGEERDTEEIRVDVTAPDPAVEIITEG